MNKHIKLFEQFVSEAVTFNKFIDIEGLLGDPNTGRLKMNLKRTFTVKDKDGESVISREGIFIEEDGMKIMMSDEGSYGSGETLSASFNLASLKGLSLDLAKTKMGPDFKNLKVDNLY